MLPVAVVKDPHHFRNRLAVMLLPPSAFVQDLGAFSQEVREGTDLIQGNLHHSVALVQSFKQVAADQASGQRRGYVPGFVGATGLGAGSRFLIRLPLVAPHETDIGIDAQIECVGVSHASH